MSLSPPRIAPVDALYKHITICNDFDVLFREYTHFVNMLAQNKYISIDHYAEHSRYIARLDGILNEMYVHSIDHYYAKGIVAQHDLYMRNKERLERIFHSGIKRAYLQNGAALKTIRAFIESTISTRIHLWDIRSRS